MKKNISFIFSEKKKIIYLLLFAFIFFVVKETENFYYRDTGDYIRVIGGVMNYDFLRQANNFFNLEIKHDFSKFQYISSYTIIVYFLTYIFSIFSQSFDLNLVSAIFKITYIIIFWKIYFSFLKKNILNFILFVVVSIPLLSSENLGMFSSFYQEKMVLIFLPLFLLGYLNGAMKGFFISLLAILVMASAKSQFFYLPTLALVFYLIFSRKNISIKIGSLFLVQLFSIYTAFSSSDAINLNKYHSEYFGLYQYQKINHIKIDEFVNDACIGVDAWGNKFDINYGAVQTNIGSSCIEKNSNSSHKKVLSFFIENPVKMVFLLFDEGIRKQLRADYFHVFYDYKLVKDERNIFSLTKIAKDNIFSESKLIFIVVLTLVGLFFYRNINFRIIIFLGVFAISQVYVSFFGEGYRDLSKHLFAVNFSFDLMLFFLAIVFFSWAAEKASRQPQDVT